MEIKQLRNINGKENKANVWVWKEINAKCWFDKRKFYCGRAEIFEFYKF